MQTISLSVFLTNSSNISCFSINQLSENLQLLYAYNTSSYYALITKLLFIYYFYIFALLPLKIAESGYEKLVRYNQIVVVRFWLLNYPRFLFLMKLELNETKQISSVNFILSHLFLTNVCQLIKPIFRQFIIVISTYIT